MAESTKFHTHYIHWMGPVLNALRALGGSASPREVSAWIAHDAGLTPEFTESTVKSGANRFRTQVAFARQYLVWEGLLDDSTRGQWELTPLGWKTELSIEQARQISRARDRARKPDSPPKLEHATQASLPEEGAELPIDEAQELALLDVLRNLPPYGFEKICARLLHAHGFEDVKTTRQSRDGGIDGYGRLLLSPFVSLRVVFQAKRYKDVVTRSAVGEFRNALLGRAEKGVFITTGRFTSDAKAEATRDGVVPIELIDGERLVELFQNKLVGLKLKTIYEIDHAFFDEFRRES